jgi:hypothetical protein
MAKKKPKPPDTPEVAQDADEAPAVADADEALEPVTQVTPPDDEADAVPPEDREEVAEEEAPPPRPRVTPLTLTLCVLTLLAAAGVFFVVALDHGKRQEWSYTVFLNDLYMMGLPLEEEAGGPSMSRETAAPVNLDPEAVNKAFGSRPGVERKGGEKFQAVREILTERIRPGDIGPDTQRVIFAGLGEPVTTLEQEVARVKKRLPTDIDDAAKEVAESKDLKSDNARRNLATKFLLPLAHTPFQIAALDRWIQAAKGEDLAKLLEEGARLRMLVDILGPLEEYRPVPTKDQVLANLTDLGDAKKVDDAVAALAKNAEKAKGLLAKRLDAVTAARFDPELYGEDWAAKQRTSVDKRQDIAFLLFTVSQAKKPNGEPLYPQGKERTEVVVGLNEYTRAADSYSRALRAIEQRVTRANEEELNGIAFTHEGKLQFLPEFTTKYPEEIKNIRDVQAAIAGRQFRLKELQGQLEIQKKQLAARKEYYDAAKKQLDNARAKTAKKVAELEKLQREYFTAQRLLSEATERNQQKVRQISTLEAQQKGRDK